MTGKTVRGAIVDAPRGDPTTCLELVRGSLEGKPRVYHLAPSGNGYVLLLAETSRDLGGDLLTAIGRAGVQALWVNPESRDVKDALTKTGTVRLA